MFRPTDLVQRSASPLEADPGLVRVLGLRTATVIRDRRVLAVLTVAAGRWRPPQREVLGSGTTVLCILNGLLTRDDTLFGPRDAIDAWHGSWAAHTDARLAVIGAAFVDALAAWPRAAARPPLSAGVTVPRSGPLEDRLFELLWRIAPRWGLPEADGIALPAALSPHVLSELLRTEDWAIEAALRSVRRRGVIRHRDAVLLRPIEAGDLARRDVLRAATVLQLAVARAVQEDTLALCAAIADRRTPEVTQDSVRKTSV